MKEVICPNLIADQVQCFSEATVYGHLYRANPFYYLGSQHDWDQVEWGGDTCLVPGHILFFIDIPQWRNVPFEAGDSTITESGKFTVI